MLSLGIIIVYFILFSIFYYQLNFEQLLIVIPTMFLVHVSVLVEIILKKRRDRYERKEKLKKGS